MALALAIHASPASGRGIHLRPVGSFDEPIYVTSPPRDRRLFVVERAGRIFAVKRGRVLPTPFLDIRSLVVTGGERGLISMAFDPHYASNGLFYVFFTGSGSAGSDVGDIHMDEFRVSANPNVADPNSRRRVLTIPHSADPTHNSGQLQFGDDGFLYVSVGDGNDGANAQSTENLLGKILRIDPHGTTDGAYSSPPSNPFAGTIPGRDEIWALGFRNPYRFSFDHLTGDLAIGEVGDNSFEEIDFARASKGLARGANFGWPECEGFQGVGCSGPVFTPPVFAYPHRPPCDAIIGGYVYRGTAIPQLEGRYVYSDLCYNVLRSIRLGFPRAKGDRSERVVVPGNVISFGEDASCELYVVGATLVERIVGSRKSSGCMRPGSCRKHGRRNCKRKRR